MAAREAFQIGARHIAPGTREIVDLPVSVLSDHTPVSMSVQVVHGRRAGPTMFVSGAVHGDEIIGVEIVRRLLRVPGLDRVKGTLLAVPIVNAFGLINHSRYLPDRRDLNRSFPGGPQGSLAARLAHLFVREILQRSDVGIDLHSAAVHRANLPQIRISPGRRQTAALAVAFGAPLILCSSVRDGSLRQIAAKNGVDMLLYEAGEGLRFDEIAVRTGLRGILRVMRHLGMMPAKRAARPTVAPIRSTSSTWLRAPAGGLLRTFVTNGSLVAEGSVMGSVSDPFGNTECQIVAVETGLVIGRTNLPIVNEGDGLFHVARITEADKASAMIDSLAAQLEGERLYDEDEII